MNYLITGGSGFIGSHLVEEILKRGHLVINIDNFDDFYDYKRKIINTLESVGKPLSFHFTQKEKDIQRLVKETQSDSYLLYYQDIVDLGGMQEIFRKHKIDMVIHLAALAGIRPSIEHALRYEEVNICGTMNIWELCKKYNIKKNICASSSSVYGNNKKIPFSEKDNVDSPISPYAATKKCGEILGHVYHHLYGIDMVQLRFFTVYGPRQRPDLVIHKFASLITEGKKIPFYGNGTTVRDYTYIDDIIQGIMNTIDYLEKNDRIYEIINLGENRTIALDDMLSTLEKELSKSAKKRYLPLPLGDVKRTNADIEKAKKIIQYSPKIDFQTGIKKFAEWFLRERMK